MSDSSSESVEFESADEFENDEEPASDEKIPLPLHSVSESDENEVTVSTQVQAVSLQDDETSTFSQRTGVDTLPIKETHAHHVHDEVEPPFVDEDGDVTVWDEDDEEEEKEKPITNNANVTASNAAHTEIEPVHLQSVFKIETVEPVTDIKAEEAESQEADIPKELLEKAGKRPPERGTRNRERGKPSTKKTFGAVRLPAADDSSKFQTRGSSRSKSPQEVKSSTGFSYQNTLPEDKRVDIAKPHPTPSVETKEPAKDSSGWGWGWGSSLLSSATAGVNALTNQVTSVLHTVESGFNIPDPEDLAKEDLKGLQKTAVQDEVKDEEKSENPNPSHSHAVFGSLLGGVSQLGKFVESTGSKVLTGGLETLEFLGKRTIDALQEGDPGFRKTKALLEGEKVSLSHVLREAKEKEEREAVQRRVSKPEDEPKVQFTTLFDQHNGLVYLEALEMLSKQCEGLVASKLGKFSGKGLQEKREIMEKVNTICTLDESADKDCYDMEKALSSLAKLGDSSSEKLLSTKKDSGLWLKGVDELSLVSPELRVDTLTWLCRLLVAGLEFYHKVGERIMVAKLDYEEWEELSVNLEEFTQAYCFVLSNFAEAFSHSVAKVNGSSELTTELFLEAFNCELYLKNALQLVIPILTYKML